MCKNKDKQCVEKNISLFLCSYVLACKVDAFFFIIETFGADLKYFILLQYFG